MSMLLSFLGGSAFRMIWGEISAWLTAHQSHKQEVERMRLQGELDAEAHKRNLESLRLQAELGVKEVVVKAEADVARVDAEGRFEVIRSTTRRIGVAWLDAWNASIRPAAATWALTMITFDHFKVIMMGAFGWELCGVILGIYVADRTLFKRGK